MKITDILIIILVIPVGFWLLSITYRAPYRNNSLLEGILDIIEKLVNLIKKVWQK